MPTCLLCKKDVTSGYAVCGDCAENMKPGTMQPALYGFAVKSTGTSVALRLQIDLDQISDGRIVFDDQDFLHC